VVEMGIAPKCLPSLTKDHVVKDQVALSFLTQFFRIYLQRQTIDHLAATMRRSGLRDVLLIFPSNMRDKASLDAHFKKEGLPQIVDWYAKVALSEIREETKSAVARMINDEDSNENVSK
jgi:hypothetical protein